MRSPGTTRPFSKSLIVFRLTFAVVETSCCVRPSISRAAWQTPPGKGSPTGKALTNKAESSSGGLLCW